MSCSNWMCCLTLTQSTFLTRTKRLDLHWCWKSHPLAMVRFSQSPGCPRPVLQTHSHTTRQYKYNRLVITCSQVKRAADAISTSFTNCTTLRMNFQSNCFPIFEKRWKNLADQIALVNYNTSPIMNSSLSSLEHFILHWISDCWIIISQMSSILQLLNDTKEKLY